MSRHERLRNPFTPFWIQVMFSVFRWLKYDDIKPNHAKKTKKRKIAIKKQKRKKTQNCTTAGQTGGDWPKGGSSSWAAKLRPESGADLGQPEESRCPQPPDG